MAKPPDLVRVIAEATGLPLSTVTDLDRRLVTGGLRPVGGRGLHAAKLEPIHAARLLTAVLASPQSTEAANSVTRYARTRPDAARSTPRLFAGVGVDELSQLPAQHGFVDALVAIIVSASNGTLASKGQSNSHPHVEVFAFTRAVHGRIRISGPPKEMAASVEYVPAVPRSNKPSRETGTSSLGDLEQSRRITESTILAVAQLFQEK